jgi:hypothetical protein
MFPEAWLRDAIEQATGVTAWPVDVPEGQMPPFVVFARSATLRESPMDAPGLSPQATFDVMVYSPRYIDGKELADRIRRQVDKFTGTSQGVTIQEAALVDERDGEVVEFGGEGKPIYSVEMTFLVRFVEAI